MKHNKSSIYGVHKMFFFNRKKSCETEEISTIPGIEAEGVAALEELGFKKVSELKGKDAEEMYYELSVKRGEVTEKTLLYQFRCAIYFATVKKADPKKLHWWYWKDSSANDEIISVEQLIEVYKND